MKRLLLILFLLCNLNAFAQKTIIYVVEIKEEINAAAAKKLSKGIEDAKKIGADHMILHLKTYGGAVDAADTMRTALLNLSIPTSVFVDNQAISAGALISIACDSIYMRRGGSIGAATVVNQAGEPMPDKYQSFMRAMMRSTAEVNGRDPRIAEAMVDPSVYIPGIIDSSKVLSFTTEEAIKYGYCEGVAESIEEVASTISSETEYEIKYQRLTLIDRVLLFFLTPFMQGLLLMVIVGGIYFELQSPGIGFPSIAALTAAVLYFSPLYLEGLAENWEIVIFVSGVLLILAEIFVIPGFGIAGISGIVLMVTGLAFAMIDNNLFYYDGNFNFVVLLKPVSIVLLSAFVSLLSSIFLAGKYLNTKTLPAISLSTVLDVKDGFSSPGKELDYLVGRYALVVTHMRPSGKIDVDGKWFEATMEFGTADKGERVVISRSEGGRLYCEHPAQ